MDPYSNSRSLADVDRRRAFIEIILAANVRAPCPECPVYFQDFKDVAVFWNLIPPGSFEDTRVAVTAMLALSEAKFYPQALINIFDSFLQDFLKSNPRKPYFLEPSNGDKELYKLSKEAACMSLVKFLSISETCKAQLPTRFANVYVLCQVQQNTESPVTTVATTNASMTEATTAPTTTEATTTPTTTE
nr:hypothetical protein BgiMline_021712 [Biomphalaria glabrata]